MRAQERQPGIALSAILIATSALAMALPAWVVTHPPAIARPRPKVLLRHRVVPPAELPQVEPVAFVDLSPEDAKAYNAAIPFSTLPNPAARPFRFAGSAEDRARATDCLAAGVLYEAGDDGEGERAVAQVVLNRLRHPAFPKTVCGVVFEGEDRRTGCQFSFSCDHALTRWTPTTDAWRRAREVAAMALAGSVYRPVGYATHYHTDWVVPYWQASLDKITAVHSHLFFRWTGWWGTPPAFDRRLAAGEPVIAQLAPLSDAHRTGAALAGADAALLDAAEALGLAGDDGTASAIVTGAAPGDAVDGDNDDGSDGDFIVTLPRGLLSADYPALALKTCGTRRSCRFAAWADAAKTPRAFPFTPEQVATMTFSYLREGATGIEKPLWNCAQVARPDRRQCMKQQVLLTGAPVDKGPEDLGGVRRKAAANPPPPAGGGTAQP